MRVFIEKSKCLFLDKSHELDMMTQRNLEISEVDEDELLSCVQGQMSKVSKDLVRKFNLAIC